MDVGHYNSQNKRNKHSRGHGKKTKKIGLYMACAMRIFYFNFCGVIKEENMHLFQAQKS